MEQFHADEYWAKSKPGMIRAEPERDEPEHVD